MIDFSLMDPNTMNPEQLREFLRLLRIRLAELDDSIPEEDSEAYESWAEEHEALEDEVDDVLDLLDEWDDE